MNEETTARLEQILLQIEESGGTRAYMEQYLKNENAPDFCAYMNATIAQKSLDIPQLIADSGISSNYAYQILNGRKKKPGRDKVIALCVAARLSFTETNRALKLAGTSPLYVKQERDIWITVGINDRIGTVVKLNLLLDEHGMRPLDV